MAKKLKRKKKIKMRKLMRKVLALSLCACMMVGMATSASALSGQIPQTEWNEIMQVGTIAGYYSSWLNRTGDTDHGWVYSFDQNREVVLNQYTSGVPQAGSRVSTWKYIPNDESQQWRNYYTFDGKLFISPVKNKNLFLEIYRTSASSTVELQARCNTYVNNFYEDGEMNTINYGDTAFKFMLPGRTTNGNYYNARYLSASGQATPVGDGNNTSKYVMWNNQGSSLYLF